MTARDVSKRFKPLTVLKANKGKAAPGVTLAQRPTRGDQLICLTAGMYFVILSPHQLNMLKPSPQAQPIHVCALRLCRKKQISISLHITTFSPSRIYIYSPLSLSTVYIRDSFAGFEVNSKRYISQHVLGLQLTQHTEAICT